MALGAYTAPGMVVISLCAHCLRNKLSVSHMVRMSIGEMCSQNTMHTPYVLPPSASVSTKARRSGSCMLSETRTPSGKIKSNTRPGSGTDS